MSTPLTAFIVCVDYHDYLALTLPYNRHHFRNVVIITTEQDKQTQDIGDKNFADVYCTDVFYRNGAKFNKFAAMEEVFDSYGRSGWICIMDADVLWPKHIDWEFQDPEKPQDVSRGTKFQMQAGKLYTPLRRMWEEVTPNIPQEPYWAQFPLHPQQAEFAGYTQIFHGSDPHLVSAPWHQTNWKHAGGADSFFQMKWPAVNKVRPPFTCLHLGKAGMNWCGRATPMLDGTVLPQSSERLAELRHMLRVRQATKSYQAEKL
jgi:hypothetical protein